MRKRAYILALTALLLCAMLLPGAAAAAPNDIAFQMDPVSNVKPGQTFAITVKLTGGPAAVCGFDFSVSYNANLLTYVEGSLRSDVFDEAVSYSKPGKVSCVWERPSNLKVQPGTVFTLNFKAAETFASSTNITLSMGNVYKLTADSPAQFETVYSAKEDAASATVSPAASAADAAVTALVNKIDNLGAVEATDAYRSKLDSALADYAALSAAQKRQVTNYGVLTEKYRGYTEKREDTATAEAKKFLEDHTAVLALRTDTVALTDEAAVTAALKAWEALPVSSQLELTRERMLLKALDKTIYDLNADNREREEQEKLEQDAKDAVAEFKKNNAWQLALTVDKVLSGHRAGLGVTKSDLDAIQAVNERAFQILTEDGTVKLVNDLLGRANELYEQENPEDLEYMLEADSFRSKFGYILSVEPEDLVYDDVIDVNAAYAAYSILRAKTRSYLVAEGEHLEKLMETADTLFPEPVTVPGETVFLPGETVVIPGETVTAPGETVVVPGETVIVPGETVIVPGETVVVPGETVVVPGETVTVPGETVIVPGETVVVPGETVVIPGETVTVPGETVVKTVEKDNGLKEAYNLLMGTHTKDKLIDVLLIMAAAMVVLAVAARIAFWYAAALAAAKAAAKEAIDSELAALKEAVNGLKNLTADEKAAAIQAAQTAAADAKAAIDSKTTVTDVAAAKTAGLQKLTAVKGEANTADAAALAAGKTEDAAAADQAAADQKAAVDAMKNLSAEEKAALKQAIDEATAAAKAAMENAKDSAELKKVSEDAAKALAEILDEAAAQDFVNGYVTGQDGKLYTGITTENADQILSGAAAWAELTDAQKAKVNAKIAAANKDVANAAQSYEDFTKAVGGFAENAAQDFVQAYLTDKSGDFYKAATKDNCKAILAAVEAWNKLSQVEKDAINAKLIAAGGMTFEKLMEAAEDLNPKTGDSNPLALWGTLMTVSCLAVLLIASDKKRFASK